MKIYLVEEYSPEITFEKNSLIIALTPKTMYKMDKLKIHYSIIEDYYGENELINENQGNFTFSAQLNWVNEFDDFLEENIHRLKELNLRLCNWYFYFIKTTIDSLIIRSNILKTLFEKINPSDVVYITANTEDTPPDFKLFFCEGKSILLRLLPLFCKKYSVSFKCIITAKEEPKSISIINYFTPTLFARKLESFIRSNRHLLDLAQKSLFFIDIRNAKAIYEGKYSSFRSDYLYSDPFLSRHRQLNILMLKSGYGGELFVKDALKSGHNIFLKSENTIYKYTVFGLIKYHEIKKDEEISKDVWQTTSELLINQTKILGWINEKCGIDVSEIILPRLEYFISSICSNIFEVFNDFVTFYNRNNIDYVITPHEWFPDEFTAMAAIRQSKKTKSVCFTHGSAVYVSDMWNITEIDHHDFYFTPYEELSQYYKDRSCLCGEKKKLIFSCFGSYLFSHHVKIKQKREKMALLKYNKARPKIIYLPTFLTWDLGRIDEAMYSATWYYKFQKALIEHFSTKKEFDFIWKGLPTSENLYNPIPDFIEENKFNNIKIATDSFANHLITADRVIADFPSTGFYEAVIAGVPTMSLYHRNFKVRTSALEFFGQLVQPFSNISEALEKIDKFLESDLKLYCTSIPLGSGAIKILEDFEKYNRKKQEI